MPRWVPVEETGILLREKKGYVLSLSGGGYWVLEDLPWRIGKYLGKRVTVKGTRTGFNSISVKQINFVEAG